MRCAVLIAVSMIYFIGKKIFVLNSMYLLRQWALLQTASKILTTTALVLVTTLNITSALISANLLISKMFLALLFLYTHFIIFIVSISRCRCRGLLFALLSDKKSVLAEPKNCDTAKNVPTNGKKLNQIVLEIVLVYYLSTKISLAVVIIATDFIGCQL